MIETDRHKWYKVFEENGIAAENNECDPTIGDVLLVFETAIYGQQYVEFRSFSLFQKFTVFESRKAGIPSGLTIVPREVMAQLLVYTLVKQNPHSGLRR